MELTTLVPWRSFFCLAAICMAIALLGASGKGGGVPHAKPTPSPGPSAGHLAIFGRYVGEYAGNTSGGTQLASAFASEFQLGANYTVVPSQTGDAGVLHFIFTERWGSSLTNNALANIASVQEIYGDALTPRLTELDYEQGFNGGKLDVHFGRVIMQNDFAASSTYWGGNLWCRYQTNAICGTPLAAPNNSGYGYYPSSEWGAYGKLSPVKTFYVEAGAFQVNPVYAQRGQGFNLGLYGTTGVDFPVEFGWLGYDKNGNYDGSIRLGGYFDTSVVPGAASNLSRFVAPGNPALAQIPATTYRGRSGGWLLADHLISGTSAPHGRGIAAWLAYEFGDAQTAFISNFFDGGVVAHGTFKGRDDDTVALGYYYIDVNPALRSFESSLLTRGYSVPVNGQEREIELNYGIAAAPAILVRPGVQYVIRPAGNVAIPNALVWGCNVTFSY